MLRTIRSKMIFAFAVSLFSVLVLAVFHLGSLSTLRERYLISERVEDLQNDILEVRRFEKNFLLYHDVSSLREGLDYLDEVDRLAGGLTGGMAHELGEKAYREFLNDLEAYRTALSRLSERGKPTPEETEAVRTKGKALTDFATRLLSAKRARIHETIRQSLALPFAFVGVFLAVTIAVVALVSTRVLRPLALLRETTRRVGDGDFRPVALRSDLSDEISGLMGAFNRMAHQIEVNQEDLLQARKMAALGTFTAGVAHELNNPLNNIALTADALREDYAETLDADGRELVDDITGQADRAADIVRNLLDFSRTERPPLVLLDPAEVVRSSLNLVKNQIQAAGVCLETEYAPRLPAIRGDMRSLQQVLVNIVQNAAQATPPGGVVRVETCLGRDAGHIRINVADTGPGIAPSVREHIFEPFFTTKGVGKGTGLGLAVAYSLVKRHGGRIEVECPEGGGAVFTVRLPVAPSATSEDAPEQGTS
ncbi:integral membrane sensor signal transduction histidine kinase [Solidesulfovibrio fructosivorans JJ]]|uniref:histidine kinase n=1 Tax=Solidesulfovibrio fructosivorans JJ] TaxID=596151 RepID=E1K180_SOLFR|nr:ATP-binding protein [Solidesulfovibrio fructosivorans]EFL49640.1 integral membrane sensor signal transduction histidine kinase [Solidesulfovibrio fructosivorans JJ]]